MTKSEALEAIKDCLEDSLEYFQYFDSDYDGDEHADIWWEIKDAISSIEKKIQ